MDPSSLNFVANERSAHSVATRAQTRAAANRGIARRKALREARGEVYEVPVLTVPTAPEEVEVEVKDGSDQEEAEPVVEIMSDAVREASVVPYVGSTVVEYHSGPTDVVLPGDYAEGVIVGFEPKSVVNVVAAEGVVGFGVVVDTGSVVTASHLVRDEIGTIAGVPMHGWDVVEVGRFAVCAELSVGYEGEVLKPTRVAHPEIGQLVKLAVVDAVKRTVHYSAVGRVVDTKDTGEVIVRGVKTLPGLSGAPYVCVAGGHVIGVHIGVNRDGSTCAAAVLGPPGRVWGTDLDRDDPFVRNYRMVRGKRQWESGVSGVQGEEPEYAVVDVPGREVFRHDMTVTYDVYVGSGPDASREAWLRRLGASHAVFVVDLAKGARPGQIRAAVRLCAPWSTNIAAAPLFGPYYLGGYRRARDTFTLKFSSKTVQALEKGDIPTWALEEVLGHDPGGVFRVARVVSACSSLEAAFRHWVASGGRFFVASVLTRDEAWLVLTTLMDKLDSSGVLASWLRDIRSDHVFEREGSAYIASSLASG